MVNKLGIIFCTVLFICLGLVSLINAEECLNDTCSANLTDSNQEKNCPFCEDLNCDNFVWVESYIKNNLSSNITSDQLNFINLLKVANYGMQEDLDTCLNGTTIQNLQNELNICEKKAANYKGLSILFGIIIFLLVINLIYRIFILIKKD